MEEQIEKPRHRRPQNESELVVTKGLRSPNHCSHAQCLHFPGGGMAGPHPSSELGYIACREALELGKTAPRESVISTQASDPGSPCNGVPASSAPSGPHQSPPHPEECRGIAGKKNIRVRGTWLPYAQDQTGPSAFPAPGRGSKLLRPYMTLLLQLDFRNKHLEPTRRGPRSNLSCWED